MDTFDEEELQRRLDEVNAQSPIMGAQRGFQGVVGGIGQAIADAPGFWWDILNTKQRGINEANQKADVARAMELKKETDARLGIQRAREDLKHMNVPQASFKPLPPKEAPAAPPPPVDRELQREYAPPQAMSGTPDQDTADARNSTQAVQPEPTVEEYILRKERQDRPGQIEALGQNMPSFREGPEKFQVDADQAVWDAQKRRARMEDKLGTGLATLGRGVMGAKTGVNTSKYDINEEPSDETKDMADQFSPQERADLSSKYGIDVPVGMSVSRFQEIFPEIAKAAGMEERNALMAANTAESLALRRELAAQKQGMAEQRIGLDREKFEEEKRATSVTEDSRERSLQNRERNTDLSYKRFGQPEAGVAMKLQDIENAESAYVDILEGLDSGKFDEALGPYQGRLNKVARFFGVGHPERLGAAAALANALAMELKKFSGAQVSEKEFARWTSIIGSATDTENVVRQLAEQMLNKTRREKERFIQKQAYRGKDMEPYRNESPVEAIPQMGGRKQYKVRDPKDGSMVVMPLSDEDVEKVRQAGGEVTPYME